MPRAELKEVSIYYEISGRADAPVLMLSSSLGTTGEMWKPQLEAFGRDYQVLRYDMRGHGRSSTPPGPYSIQQLAADVVALLDSLGLDKVDYCGLSIGGMIGQWLGANLPSRLNRLILCNTAAKIGTEETWNGRIAAVQVGGMAAIIDGGAMERWFTPGFRNARSPMFIEMRDMLAATDPVGYIAACAAIRDMDQRATAASIVTSTLVIACEHDPVTTVSDAQFLHDSISGSTLTVLPASHISNVEAAQQFNAAVLGFLAGGPND